MSAVIPKKAVAHCDSDGLPKCPDMEMPAVLKKTLGVMKKPACKKKAEAKKAAPSASDFVPYKLSINAEGGTKTRNNYSSKAYKKAKNLAVSHGLSDEQVKAETSRVLKAAGQLWDSKFK